MKIVTILGARPQFIKASLISKYFKDSNIIDEVIIHTGQHYNKNMSDDFFDQLAIPNPKYKLNINQMNHGEMTGRMLIDIEKILLCEKPKAVLVYGDTNSTLAGGLASVKLNIPVFHIEAGLRSYNRSMPEEINRIVTDHLSSLLFCPTRNSIDELSKEGITKGVIDSGDIMYELFLKNSKKIKKNNSSFILATIHRPMNTDDPTKLSSIIKSLERINKLKKIIFPVHPRTKNKLKKYGIKPKFPLIEPVHYLGMIKYLINADLVITDSGGLQKEAYFAKTKCITIRPETEWIELINSGVNILSDSLEDEIWSKYQEMIKRDCDFSKNFYGDGNTANKIVKSIIEFLND